MDSIKLMHGTDHDFIEFDPTLTSRQCYGPGVYLTNDLSTTERYGKRTLEVMVHYTGWADRDMLDNACIDITGLKVNEDAYSNYLGAKLLSINDIFYVAESYESAVAFLKSKGYTGIKIEICPGVVYYTVWDQNDLEILGEINRKEYWREHFKIWHMVSDYVDSIWPLVIALDIIG